MADIFFSKGSFTCGTNGSDTPASGTSQSWAGCTTTNMTDVNGNRCATGSRQARFVDAADTGTAPEIIIVTNDNGSGTLTVTRGAEGSTTVAHANGATFKHVHTSGSDTVLANPTLPNTDTGQNVTASTSTTPVNVTAGSVANVALNANTTVSFTSAPASPWGLLLVFTQDATGGRTVAFSGISGTSPTIGSAANAVTGVAVTRDNAGNIYAAVAFTA